MNQKGKIIVIEGLDGSGKSTQIEILFDKLTEMGFDAKRLKFPDYDSKSSELVKMYLNGEIGEIEDVNLYAASTFYSADRYISYKTVWQNGYENGCLYTLDRYTTSNIIYQMAKLEKTEWDKYIEWLWDFEFVRMNLPEPDLVIYLDMPPKLSKILMEKRYSANGGKMDIHEKNTEYLEKCREAAFYASKKLGWNVISCAEAGGNEALKIEDVSEKILAIVLGFLA